MTNVLKPVFLIDPVLPPDPGSTGSTAGLTGLHTYHQIEGRIGRGKAPSLFLLRFTRQLHEGFKNPFDRAPSRSRGKNTHWERNQTSTRSTRGEKERATFGAAITGDARAPRTSAAIERRPPPVSLLFLLCPCRGREAQLRFPQEVICLRVDRWCWLICLRVDRWC